jgi:small subunit ribosomal protein S3
LLTNKISEIPREDVALRKVSWANLCATRGARHQADERKIEVTFTLASWTRHRQKGAEIDVLKQELKKLTGKDIWIEVEEIKRPDLDAQLVADGIAKQLERRVPFRRVMKKALQAARDAGAAGIKVQVSGRIGGAEIARTEWYKEGRVPLHTIRAEINYAMGRAETTYGSIGVKVWINKGEETSPKVGG